MYKELEGEKAFAAAQYEKEREYWVKKLSGELEKTGFPPDMKPTASQEKKQDTLAFQFPRDIFDRLTGIIAGSDSRLHMVLVTGIILLLYKYTGKTDIIIGTPIHKQKVEGDFINSALALRFNIHHQITVKELLTTVRQTIIEARRNQNYPVETLPYDLNMTVDESGFPLFDIAVLLRNFQDESYIDHLDLNMIFSFYRTGDYLEGIVQYNTSLFKIETIERIIRHFIYLVREAFNHVDLKLADVPILAEEERERLIFDFNKTAADYPRDKTIHQLFEEQVEKTPDKTAVSWGTLSITYKKINCKANQLARLLREKGIKPGLQGTRSPGTIAAVMSENSADIPIALTAVLKAGGAYLPMGIEYPGERINYLLKNSSAQILLTRKSLVENMEVQCPIIYLDDPELYTGDGENPEPAANKDSLAYVIYTSGTTGEPKGVMVEHRALVNYIWWAAQTYIKEEPMDFPLYTSISFDLTVTSIFTPLISGNAVIVYSIGYKETTVEKIINHNRVGVIKLTPSHLKLIQHKKVKNSSIKQFIVGGEQLETQLAREIYNNFAGNIEIYNEYGPTETVVGSMIYKFDPGADTRHAVPIGKPIANTQIYLLNRHYQPVPVGAAGEIFISGDSLARGYLYNPGLSKEKFLPNPFIPGQKVYSTGDLGVRLPNGNIEFIGRRDQQVKIRGYRVEVGEIEAKIVDFQEKFYSKRMQEEYTVKKLDLKSLARCKTCLLPINYPGIHFDEHGVCDTCREYESYKDQAKNYFKTPDDFYREVEKARKSKKSDYDCLMHYSGGKDSSYVLHRLTDMGLKVLAFTFDNGFISDKAFENIKRSTSLLKVDNIILDSEAMKEIFVESLCSESNVCNGCFKAVNTLGTKVAHDHNINLVVTGLSRGQIFEIKLHGLFKLGIFDEKNLQERLKLFRQNYHSMTHRTSRLIKEEITDQMLDSITFVDYFRYDDVSVQGIFDYLKQKDKGWVRPADTGTSSSNCIINDVGIYVHLKDKGFHFYSPQLSWDCRLGTITREEGIDEITGYKPDYPRTHRILNEIGYYEAHTGAVVLDVVDGKGEKALCAYIVSEKEFDFSVLKAHLTRELPAYMIPTYFVQIDKIPLTAAGKINRKALPEPELKIEGKYSGPRNEMEKKLAEIWSELLGIEQKNIGIDTNFFELGGHSLRATFLVAAVHKEYNVLLSLGKVFEIPTIRKLAKHITNAAKETFVSIPAAEKKEYYSLSSAQDRLYILQQMDLNSTAYNIYEIVELKQEPVPGEFLEIFTALVHRHESLRTSFRMIGNQPVQKVHDQLEFEIEYYQVEVKVEEDEGTRGLAPLSKEPATRSSQPVTALIRSLIHPFDLSRAPVEMEKIIKAFVKPFDLSRAPLIRVGLVKISSSRHVLMVDMHHIVSDGISHGILVGDFTALAAGRELPALKLHYKDYSQWQNKDYQCESMENQETYWLQIFSHQPPVLNLPLDFPRPPMQSFEGNSLCFVLNEKETRALKNMAEESGVTLYMSILAVLNVLLSKLGGIEDIIVGTPVAARRHTQLRQIIGMFVNTLAMRNYPSAQKTFGQFLEEVKEQTLNAYEHQEYPFEKLVDKISVQRDTSRNPLFDVMLNLLNQAEYRRDLTGIDEERIYEYIKLNAKFDLNFTAIDYGDKIYIDLEYCSKLFKAGKIEGIISYFRNVLSLLAANIDIKISEVEIISHEEKEKILELANGPVIPPGTGKTETLHQLFEEQVERASHRLALTFKDRQLTYGKLNRAANHLAGRLRERGAAPDQVVGLMVKRTIDIVIGMLAVMKAGGAYLPIDPQYPPDRKRFMIEDSAVKILLKNYNDNKLSHIPGKIEMIDLKDEGISRGEEKNLKHINKPNHLAYVIYTSGSTGRPRGALLEHRNLVNLLIYCYRFTNMDFSAVLQYASISFDASFHEIFSTLLAGGKLTLIHEEMRTDIPGLFKIIEKNDIKTVFLPISLLKLIFNEEMYAKSFPGGIRHIQTAGEQVVISDRFRDYLKEKNIYLHNHYGPSETHVVTALTLDPRGEIPGLPSIGKPIANTAIYILDKYRNLQPVGLTGDLYVAGLQVGRGYLGKPELTAQRFIKIETHMSHRSHMSYIYKTGDLAKWMPDGNIEFTGREDYQVKIRGMRIELGEIENQLQKWDKIKEAIVLAKEDKNREKYLCAYIVTEKNDTSSPSQWRSYLSQQLPDYMIPLYFVKLDKMPLTPNGKINRKALPHPEIKTGEGYISPRDEIEKKLAGAWSRLLGIEENIIGIDSNFFKLGGHSLKATILAAEIHKEFNVKLPIARIFKTPTIKGLAPYIRQAGQDPFAPIEPVEKKEYYLLSSAQKRLYILQQTDVNTTAYNMPLIMEMQEEPDEKKLKETFEKLIQKHESLRTSFEVKDSDPVQKIHNNVEFEIEYYDMKEVEVKVEVEEERSSILEGTRGLAPLSEESPLSSVLCHLSSEFVRPFDLAEAPLIRVGLLKIEEKKYLLMVDMHHIISDGVSSKVLEQDFSRLYRGAALTGLRLQYRDYSEWMSKQEGEVIKKQGAYWLKQFTGVVPVLNLPTDYARPNLQDFEGRSINFIIEKEETKALHQIALAEGTTLFMLLLAIYYVMLAKLSGQDDIVIGTPTAGRRHAHLEKIIGIFLNTLPLRNYPTTKKIFKVFLKEVKKNTIDAFENQDYPFEKMVEALGKSRDISRNPLFDVMFIFQNMNEPGTETDHLDTLGLNLKMHGHTIKTSKFDLNLQTFEAGGKILFRLDYSTKLFKKEKIELFIKYYKDIISSVINDPGKRISEIALRDEKEKEKFLSQLSDQLEEE